jgi:hypothetical protein
MIADVNSILREYLASQSEIIELVSNRIYCPRLPENCALPAIGFFVRGGNTSPYIPVIVSSSVQIDCWGDNPVIARQVYRVVYESLQGMQWQSVIIGNYSGCNYGGDLYMILSAIEEVHGQDLQDEVPGYFRVLSFWSLLTRVAD